MYVKGSESILLARKWRLGCLGDCTPWTGVDSFDDYECIETYRKALWSIASAQSRAEACINYIKLYHKLLHCRGRDSLCEVFD